MHLACRRSVKPRLSRLKRWHLFADADCDVIAQIGTALPAVDLIESIEHQTGKPVIACNASLLANFAACGHKRSITVTASC